MATHNRYVVQSRMCTYWNRERDVLIIKKARNVG